jgi:hypothetical protein
MKGTQPRPPRRGCVRRVLCAAALPRSWKREDCFNDESLVNSVRFCSTSGRRRCRYHAGGRRCATRVPTLLRDVRREHVGVVASERVCGRRSPVGWLPPGLGVHGCRGGVHSVVTSVTAARAADSSTMALSALNAATRAWTARLFTALGRPRGSSEARIERETGGRCGATTGAPSAGAAVAAAGRASAGPDGPFGGCGHADASAMVRTQQLRRVQRDRPGGARSRSKASTR